MISFLNRKLSLSYTECHTMGVLIHWGQVTLICFGKLNTIGSDNGLSPGRHQAIIWTNDVIFLIGTLRKKLQWSFNWNSYIFFQENALEIAVGEMATILSRSHCVKAIYSKSALVRWPQADCSLGDPDAICSSDNQSLSNLRLNTLQR